MSVVLDFACCGWFVQECTLFIKISPVKTGFIPNYGHNLERNDPRTVEFRALPAYFKKRLV
jgi:hypothetical protein